MTWTTSFVAATSSDAALARDWPRYLARLCARSDSALSSTRVYWPAARCAVGKPVRGRSGASDWCGVRDKLARMITPGELEAIRLQAETTTSLLKRARRAIVDALQSAAQLESMAAEIADQVEDSANDTDSNQAR